MTYKILFSAFIVCLVLVSCDKDSIVDEEQIEDNSVDADSPDSEERENDSSEAYGDGKTAESWVNGRGFLEDPYLIETVGHLLYLAETVNDTTTDSPTDYSFLFFRLENDIDLEGVEWSPIGGGNGDSVFNGILDGNGREISNLNINDASLDYVGLFGRLGNRSSVQNLVLKNCDIKGRDHVGGVVGYSKGEQISNVCVNGLITGRDYVGGIIGKHDVFSENPMENLCFDGKVNGNNQVGGISGNILLASVQSSWSKGEVNGNDNVGGLVGEVNLLTLTSSFSTSSITGNNAVGGLLGKTQSVSSYSADVEGCYFEGMVTGEENVGGIAGIFDTSRVSRSYNSGTVEARNRVAGGLAGKSYNGSFHLSYNSGSIIAPSNAGGIVARTSSSNNYIVEIYSCYNTGDVSSNYYAGAFVGYADSADIENGYNIGTIADTGNGSSWGFYTDGAFAYTTTVGHENTYFLDEIHDFTHARTSEEMKSPAFIDDLHNYYNIHGEPWKSDLNPNINNGFPILKWQQ